MARFAQLLTTAQLHTSLVFGAGIWASKVIIIIQSLLCVKGEDISIFCFQQFDGHFRHISNCAFRPSIVHLSTTSMVEDNSFKIRDDGVKWNLKWHVRLCDEDGKILSRDGIQQFMSSISERVYGLDKIHLTIIQLIAAAALFSSFIHFKIKMYLSSLDSHLEFISIFYFSVCVVSMQWCSWKFLLCRLKMKRKATHFNALLVGFPRVALFCLVF